MKKKKKNLSHAPEQGLSLAAHVCPATRVQVPHACNKLGYVKHGSLTVGQLTEFLNPVTTHLLRDNSKGPVAVRPARGFGGSTSGGLCPGAARTRHHPHPAPRARRHSLRQPIETGEAAAPAQPFPQPHGKKRSRMMKPEGQMEGLHTSVFTVPSSWFFPSVFRAPAAYCEGRVSIKTRRFTALAKLSSALRRR